MLKKSFRLLMFSAVLCSMLPVQSQKLPEGKGKDLVVATCSNCHAFRMGGGDIVRNTSVTPDGGFVLANSLTNEVSLVTVSK